MVGWVRLKVRGPGRHDGDAAPRRGARQGRQLLHRQPARGEAAGDATPQGRRRTRCTSRTSPSRASATSPSRAGPASRRSTASPASSSTRTCRSTGAFETSNPLLNQLQHNIVWGQKGNFLDVPTDCPQRDERLGWTGDAQVFSRTACFNMDVAGFFTKWLGDLAADQNARGQRALRRARRAEPAAGQVRPGGSAAWADAAAIIPWNMYLAYGDTRLLERQYPSMKAWVEYMRREAGDDEPLDDAASTSATGSPSPRPRPTTRAPRPART